eukprot:TRINITY_DN782399_c0_g1_i1.p1 TRINITY_DN782399_c0_g1~~TRINITY_DN782399_c0_g1_i1.p1  ORF type:complete len:155 (+),score=10.63 TRINITY_DN782399_c0_g1_i1:305-769(+)
MFIELNSLINICSYKGNVNLTFMIVFFLVFFIFYILVLIENVKEYKKGVYHISTMDLILYCFSQLISSSSNICKIFGDDEYFINLFGFKCSFLPSMEVSCYGSWKFQHSIALPSGWGLICVCVTCKLLVTVFFFQISGKTNIQLGGGSFFYVLL